MSTKDADWVLTMHAAMADAATRHYLPDDVRARIADGTEHVDDLFYVVELDGIVRPDVGFGEHFDEFVEHGRQLLEDMPPSQKDRLRLTLAAARDRSRVEEAVLIAAEEIVQAAE